MTDAENAAFFARRHRDATIELTARAALASSATVDLASLAKLLIAKGLITELEYLQALAEGMEDELARFLERRGARAG